jgi:hypothetical protein
MSLWILIRLTMAVSAGTSIFGMALVATSRIGVDDRGSNVTFTGSPNRLPGDSFQSCPSH